MKLVSKIRCFENYKIYDTTALERTRPPRRSFQFLCESVAQKWRFSRPHATSSSRRSPCSASADFSADAEAETNGVLSQKSVFWAVNVGWLCEQRGFGAEDGGLMPEVGTWRRHKRILWHCARVVATWFVALVRALGNSFV